MKFIINILPNSLLDAQNLASFVANITSQYQKSELAMVLKRGQQVPVSVINAIQDQQMPITVVDAFTDVTLADDGSTYWLNLHVDDGLLPNATMQWENTLTQHPVDLLMLNSINNDSSIGSQVDVFLDRMSDVNLNTMAQVFGIRSETEWHRLSLLKKLNLLMGLQSYYVNDLGTRYRTFFNSVDLTGRNVLYRVDQAKLSSPKPYLAQLLYDLIANDEYLKLNMPTLILGDNSIQEQVDQGIQMVQNRQFIFDDKIANYYFKSLMKRLVNIYSAIAEAPLSQTDKAAFFNRLKPFVAALDAEFKKQLKQKLAQNRINDAFNE